MPVRGRPIVLAVASLLLFAHAAPAPADSDLVRIRAACASAKRVKVSARHLGSAYDSVTFDAAGAHAWFPVVPDYSISTACSTRDEERILPWADVRRIEAPNPKAR